jgi:hypothetical protein
MSLCNKKQADKGRAVCVSRGEGASSVDYSLPTKGRGGCAQYRFNRLRQIVYLSDDVNAEGAISY